MSYLQIHELSIQFALKKNRIFLMYDFTVDDR